MLKRYALLSLYVLALGIRPSQAALERNAMLPAGQHDNVLNAQHLCTFVMLNSVQHLTE
jgi:hypothetical protein